MNIFVSVVSHDHQHIIANLDSLRRLALHKHITVICRDNVPNPTCREYCEANNVIYLANTEIKGFSANNNANYVYAKNTLGMTCDDYFVLMNPDILIDQKNIKKLTNVLKRYRPELAAPCLYIDAKQTVFDDNLRKYPKLQNFVKNYLFHDRSTVIDKKTQEPEILDYWASASFLCVQSRVYEALEGFDESYHMYCEDVDFCLRASQQGYQSRYIRSVKATHFRRRYSQKFLSRPFFWHVKSTLLYTLASNNLRRHKSVLVKSKRSAPAVTPGSVTEVSHKLS